MKGERDLVGIERLLGLRSARGISRQKNLDSPPIKAVLERVKAFSKDFVNSSNGEIRTSQILRGDAHALFEDYGPQIWPGPEEPRPAWLEDPSEQAFDGKYPRHLYYTHPADRAILWEHFYHLIVQKCCNYHDNQLQKYRRSSAKLRPEDNDLNPGTPRYDDSPEGADSDMEATGSERPSWLPINHGDSRNSVAGTTPLHSSPVMRVLPSLYHAPVEGHDGASLAPHIASPPVARGVPQIEDQRVQQASHAQHDDVDVDEPNPANESTASHYADSDHGQKRKRLDDDEGQDESQYESEHEDDHESKKLRTESDEDFEDDDSLMVKLKVGKNRLARFNGKRSLNPMASPANPAGIRTRSSSVARSTHQGENETTQVNVKQYKDSKGKWYEVTLESRPPWAVDERVITRTVPRERRRSTWVSRHAAFSPNTLSNSETRGSMGATSIPSRPSSIAGQDTNNTGRCDSVRSDEQREKEEAVAAAESLKPSYPSLGQGSDAENQAEVSKPKLEPRWEPGLESKPPPPVDEQAAAGSENSQMLIEAPMQISKEAPVDVPQVTPKEAPSNFKPGNLSETENARSLFTAFDNSTHRERRESAPSVHESQAAYRPEHSMQSLQPRKTSLPPASNNVSIKAHTLSGSGSKLADRSLEAVEPAGAQAVDQSHASGRHDPQSQKPVPQSLTAPAELRGPNVDAEDQYKMNAAGLAQIPANGSLHAVPWPQNPYANRPPTGAPPIQVQSSPLPSMGGPVNGQAPPVTGQDPRILNETARFRFVDQNQIFNGPPPPPSRLPPQQSRGEGPMKLAPAQHVSNPPQQSTQPIHFAQPHQHGHHHHHHQPPLPPPPYPQQHEHTRQHPAAAPLVTNSHVPPGLQNGPPNLPQLAPQSGPADETHPNDPDLIFDVLEQLADCPVGRYLQANCPELIRDRDGLCVIKETLLRLPAAGSDWDSLEAAIKSEFAREKYFFGTAIDTHKKASMKKTEMRRRQANAIQPGEHQQREHVQADSNIQHRPFVPAWPAGARAEPNALSKKPPVIPMNPESHGAGRSANQPTSSNSAHIHQVQQVKPPAAEPDFRSSGPAFVPSATASFHPPPPQQPPQPAHRMASQAAPAEQKDDAKEKLLDNTFIEINWGRAEVEYYDHMTMQDYKDCDTADEFFGMIEAGIPDEIRGRVTSIKEIRVRALNELQGKDRLPRFVRNNSSFRGGMRSLVKILRAQPVGTEPELEFFTIWD